MTESPEDELKLRIERTCTNYAIPLRLDVEASGYRGGVACLCLSALEVAEGGQLDGDPYEFTLTASEARRVGRFLIALAAAGDVLTEKTPGP